MAPTDTDIRQMVIVNHFMHLANHQRARREADFAAVCDFVAALGNNINDAGYDGWLDPRDQWRAEQ